MILLELDELGVFYRNLIFELVNFELILQDCVLLRLVRHLLLVDRRLVLYDLGSRGEAERRQRLVVVYRGRRDRADNGCKGVATQSHLQDTRQF